MPEVPNEVFPEGVRFGYYYNYCEEEEWRDTKARSEASVCCEGGRYRNCQEIFEEYEEEEEGGEETQSGEE